MTGVLASKNKLFDSSQDINSNNLAKIGIIRAVEKKDRKLVMEKLKTHLDDLLNIDTLYFEDMYTFKQSTKTNWVFSNSHTEEWLRGRPLPHKIGVRLGVTRLNDDENILWDRRSVNDYVTDSNSFPKRIINLLEKIQAYELPLGVNLTIWTPAEITQIDPMLVLELSGQIVIGLMRWNPTL